MVKATVIRIQNSITYFFLLFLCYLGLEESFSKSDGLNTSIDSVDLASTSIGSSFEFFGMRISNY